jgi:protein-tyrosine phosphatase
MGVRVLTELVATRRWITLEGAANFRDLGGCRTRDGRVVRWERLYRSDNLANLSPRDLARLEELGIVSVIDLRSALELRAFGRFPFEELPVRWHRLPMTELTATAIAATQAPNASSLADRYMELLDSGQECLATSLRLLGKPSTYPVVFHCTAGKDRTGLLAAVVLALLGVSDEDVLADYEASSQATTAIVDRLTERGEEGRTLASHPAFTAPHGIDPAAMQEVMLRLRSRYGSMVGYARALGVSASMLAGLEASLLEVPESDVELAPIA